MESVRIRVFTQTYFLVVSHWSDCQTCPHERGLVRTIDLKVTLSEGCRDTLRESMQTCKPIEEKQAQAGIQIKNILATCQQCCPLFH